MNKALFAKHSFSADLSSLTSVYQLKEVNNTSHIIISLSTQKFQDILVAVSNSLMPVWHPHG